MFKENIIKMNDSKRNKSQIAGQAVVRGFVNGFIYCCKGKQLWDPFD